eukprot:403335999
MSHFNYNNPNNQQPSSNNQDNRSRSRERQTNYLGRGDDYRGRGANPRGNNERGGPGPFRQAPQISTASLKGSLQLQSNHFKFGLKNALNTINMYSIEYQALGQVIDFQAKFSIIRDLKEHLKQIYGLYICQSDNLFTQTLFSEPYIVECQYHGSPVQVTINLKNSFSLDESTQKQKPFMDKLLNYVLILCKKALLDEKYNQLGRLPRFYSSFESVKINQYRLEMWPGYEFSVKCLHDGIFLNVDTRNKFVNQQTIYDRIRQYKRERYSDEEIKNMLQEEGKLVVITRYNSKQYLINDIDFDITPQSYKFDWIYVDPNTLQKERVTTNMIDYFRMKYGIQILQSEAQQPCLIVNRGPTSIVLPSSLCNEANLPAGFTKDRIKMKNLQPYKLSNPKDRYQRISEIVSKIKENPVFAQWEIQLQKDFANVKARQLNHPQVYNQYNMLSNFEEYEEKKFYHAEPIELGFERWAMVYSSETEEFEYATKLVQCMQQCSRSLGIKIEDPQWIEVPDLKTPQDMIDCMNVDIDLSYTQFVVVLIPGRSLKPDIKRHLDSLGLPSQFVLSSTVSRLVDGQRPKLGPFSMILKQINAKLQKDLYRLHLPYLRRSMIIGIDTANQGNKSLIGLTSSYNSYLTQYESNLEKHQLPPRKEFPSQYEREFFVAQERTKIIIKFLNNALKTYQNKNMGLLPERIVIFRDGIGGPTMKVQCEEIEVNEIIAHLNQIQLNYKPQIIYTLIDKMTSHRLFLKSNQDVWNPGPGTVLDTALVENQGDHIFDFFMIPHKASVATAMPVHFMVVYNNSLEEKKNIENFIYHLCYGYFNFVGPIKVPAAVMYAKKLINYAIDNKISLPNPKLSQSLHFL